MKLCSFRVGGRSSYGVFVNGQIADVGEALGDSIPDLRSGLTRLSDIEAAIADANSVRSDDVILEPPIPNAGRIICVGLNYKSHIAETGRDTPQYPILFPRYPDSLVGCGVPMVAPKASETYDFEGEMAFIIGKEGRHISAKNAM